jgi:ERCC4-type nuclease
MMITAVIIDNREPKWIKELKFNGVPVSHTILDSGDIWCSTDDGKMIVIERKTPDDLLGSLKDERLFVQMVGLAELRKTGNWPYLMITGELACGPMGKVITSRGETGWEWSAIQGALLSIQEMGVFVTYAKSDTDFEAAVMRLGNRERNEKMLVPPARLGKVLGLQAGFLCGLPGIGPDKVSAVLTECGTPAWALVALTDATSKIPGIGEGIKNNIRYALGLQNDQQMGVLLDDHGQETLKILRLGEQ